MYSSGYSQVSKYSPPAQKKMAYRSKGKSCGYYMRIVFFFSSLIQSLIIVSLVLFLVYGKKQDSASISRIQDLEESFSRLSIENVALRSQRKNLTTLLNSTMTEKGRNDWDLAQLRHVCNISMGFIQEMDKKMQICYNELTFCKSTSRIPGQCTQIMPDKCKCDIYTEHLNARLQLEKTNFTQTTQSMRIEMEQVTKDRDNLHLEVIRLRRDKSIHEKEVELLKHRCKKEFSLSLSGVSNVTKAFLEKIESLFPTHIAFQLSCEKQRENLEQIRTNCTSLSKEVEDKFQSYLNNVGHQVSTIISENSGLKAENLRLSEDYRKCTQNRTGLIEQHKKDLETMQEKHGKVVEKLLVDKFKLIGDNEILTKHVEYRTKMAEHLADQVKQLNMSCMTRNGGLARTSGPQPSSAGWNLFGGGGGGSSSSASSPSGFGQPSRTGTSSNSGSFASPFNKAGSAGTSSSSSSFLSSGSSSSSGSLFNKAGSAGTSSSSSSLSSFGSSSSAGSLFNKPVSAGTSSSSSSLSSFGSSSSAGSLFNKPVSAGTSSSSTSLSSFGSSSSAGSLFNKPVSAGTSSSSTSLSSSGSSSSAGSLFNKPGSTGGAFSSLGSAGSNPSLSSSGTGINKPALSGRGSSTSGLSSGSSGSSPSLSSSGIGLNKPTSSVKSSSGFGSSSGSTGSTGSTNKSGSSSSGFSWLGFGSSNSGQSKTGSGTGKGTSSGSYGGTGSTFGGGRTSGLGGGAGLSVSQHLQDLHRLINPASPDERQDLSRVMG